MHPPYPPRPPHPGVPSGSCAHPASGQPTLQIGGPHGISVYGHGAQQEVRMGGVVQPIHPGAPQFPPPGVHPQYAQIAPRSHPSQVGGPQGLVAGKAEQIQGVTAALDEELYRNPNRVSSLLLFGAVALSILGALFLTPMLAAPTVFVVGCFTAAAACLGGRAVVASRSRALDAKGALPLSLELSLLELAHERGGVLSVAQSARELKISLDEAEKALSRLAKRGHAEMDVDSQGEVRYRLSSGPANPPAALPAG